MLRRGPASLKKALLVIGLSLFFGSLPLLGVLVSSAVATRAGCALNEGSANSCLVGSFDAGPLLYGLFVSGWFMLVSIPAGLAGVAAGIVLLVVALFQRRAARRTPNPPT